ncbi:membrane protein [Streptomyces fumigatiscleroticus]|nr:membrane protein [Streptomyces fumigatiscleroticus]
MNTERPDHDDAEAGAAEPAGTTRDTEETAGTAATTEVGRETTGGSSVENGEKENGEDTAGDGDRDGDGSGGSRPGRRWSPGVVAGAVAAAVLLAGGGGAYLATTASGGPDGRAASGASGSSASDGTPPPLVLDGYSGSGTGGTGGTGGTNGIAPGEPNPYGVTYRADGALPDGPGPSPVYRAAGEVTREEVARLAGALGVEGTPRLKGGSWQVGQTQDGSGPWLRVDRQAPGDWTFRRNTPGDDCKGASACPAAAPASGGPVSEEAAKRAAVPVLKAAGQDDAKVDASQVTGGRRMVNADPVVGGLPTYGWSTGVTVSARGEVVGGSGRLKAPVKGDTYPVLGAERTLALMNTERADGGRMGIGGCASPVPHKDRLEAPCGASSTGPGSGRQRTVTVERAVFGLASHPAGGRPALVPSWLFEVRAPGAADASTVTHPAVEPRYLTSASPSPQPSGPGGEPSGPGGEPTAAPTPRDVDVDGYTAEGTELTVAFSGGVCADYEVRAAESGDRVRVTVTERPWPDKVCVLIAEEYHRTVPLERPLGDREVVGSDGKGVPLEKDGARLPR